MHAEQITSEGDYIERLYSADGRYLFEFDILEEVELGKTYNFDQHMDESYSGCTDYDARTKLFFRSATFTMTETDNLRHIDATATTVDGASYTIVYQEKTGIEPIDTVAFVATKLTVVDMTQYGDMATITAENDAYAIDLWLQPISSLYGAFTEENLNIQYSPLIKKVGRKQVAISRAEFTVTKVGIDPVVKGWLYCSDGILYEIDFRYELPQAKSSLTIDVPAGDLLDAAQNLHYIEAYGYDEKSDYFIDLVFVTTELEEKQYKREDLFSSYSALKAYVDDEKEYEVLSTDVALTLLSEDEASLSGTVLVRAVENHEDVVSVTLTMTCTIEHKGNGLNYDAQDEDFEKSYSVEQFYPNANHWAENHSVYLEAFDEDELSIVSVQLILPSELDLEKVGVPEGVYPISDSGEDNTVLASVGVVGGSVFPSYAGYLKETGSMDEPMWFMVSGTVTVSSMNDLPYVEVNAQNSYGRTIHVTMGGYTEGVTNVESKGAAHKFLIHGELLLHTPYGTFDILGRKL